MFHIQSDSSGCLFNTRKIISGENLQRRWGKGGWGGEWGRKIGREGWAGDEDVLTTGNLVVLQLEFPFSPLVVLGFFSVFFRFSFFICIHVPLERVSASGTKTLPLVKCFLKSRASQPLGPRLMKGCEMQCGNRFDYLLVGLAAQLFRAAAGEQRTCVCTSRTLDSRKSQPRRRAERAKASIALPFFRSRRFTSDSGRAGAASHN